MSVVAVFTEPLNSMVTPEQRAFVDKEAKAPGVSNAIVVREAIDALAVLSEFATRGERVPLLRGLLEHARLPRVGSDNVTPSE